MTGDTANNAPHPAYDSILLVSFGGPEGPDDVMPFLENVLRGKRVPRERMLEVAEHYRHFGGVSPINEQNRQLLSKVKEKLAEMNVDLPVYWGNRNWHPLLPDTLGEMQQAGHQRAMAFFTSMFSCYSGCRQYRENISDAQAAVGPQAPRIDILRKGFNHPGFIAAQATLVAQSLQALGDYDPSRTKILFSAHSIPMAMADHSKYVVQLKEACRLVSQAVEHPQWELVYQSRSGPPQQPWLEPDICDRINELASENVNNVVIVPIGFVSDHMEVLFDLDTEAKQICQEKGIGFQRTPSVGVHPEFVDMICDLIVERLTGRSNRPAVGELGPSHDVCPEDCCLYPTRRPPPVEEPASDTP